MTPNTTNISFQTFKSITDSNGQFTTWTDIINHAREALPVNNEIFNVPFKSMSEVIGDNIVLQNSTTKYVEYLRDDLSNNNKLELNKMVMFLYDDYMTSYDYELIDQKSAQEWSSLIADAVQQMFITKQDISNALALDEIQKVALALGNFTIIPNADKVLLDAQGKLDKDIPKAIGLLQIRILNSYRTKRTKFAKGIDLSEIKWVNSYEYSANLLSSLTASVAGSNEAYGDLKRKNQVREFLGMEFTQSMYLGHDLDMTEFKYTDNNSQTQTANAGIHTGNMVKPFQAAHIFSVAWVPRSLLYYGHRFETTDRPHVNSRTKSAITFMWRSQVAIHPLFAGFNHIFLSKLPTFKSYVKRDGTVVPQRNLSTYNDYVQFKKDLRAEQPMLYNTLINEDGITDNGINAEGNWTQYIADNTINLTNGLTPILVENGMIKNKSKFFSKK